MKGTQTLIAMVALAVAGCSGTASVKQAEGEIAHFHSQLDKEGYTEIWKNSANDMHQAIGEAQFERFLKAVHTKLGNVRQTKQVGWRVNATTRGSFTLVNMDTQFDRGSGVESFVYRSSGDKLLLAGYHINSTDMMMN